MADPEVLAELRALIRPHGRGADGATAESSRKQRVDSGDGAGSTRADPAGAGPRGAGRPGPPGSGCPGEAGAEASGGADSDEEPDGGGERVTAGTRPGHQQDPVARGHEIALRLLTVRDRTAAELRTRLAGRDVPDDAITEILARLSEVGLVDDAGFARQWVEQSARRHVSTSRLRRELRSKGVTDADAAPALEGRGDDDRELAEALVARKLPSMANLTTTTRYRRLAGLLTRRGFSTSVIGAVLSDLPDGSGDADVGEVAGDADVRDSVDEPGGGLRRRR